MKKSIFCGLFGLALVSVLPAQNETDALRYSRIGFGGTARFTGMAGAFGALGGDISTIGTNPAGLAIFRKNELTFTPSLFSQNVNSTYNGTTAENAKYNFRFDNFGLVFAGKTDNTSPQGWQSISFGIAYTRFNTFDADLSMTGVGNSSLLDSWVKTAAGNGPYNLDYFNEGLGWDTWLLNNVPGDSTQYTDTIPHGDKLTQTKYVTRHGSQGEWSFALGGNYSDKLYLGASLGLQQVRYEDNSDYSEAIVDDTTTRFVSYDFHQAVSTTGHGFNAKLGLIYRPIDMVRVGFSFQSPTILRLSDTYSANMTSNFVDQSYYSESPDGNYSYTVHTPMRTTASVAVIFGKAGLISADYEIVDYSQARLYASDYGFTSENNNIRAKYSNAQNIRIGAEYRLLPVSFRAGVALYGSPYANATGNNGAKMYITGGIGYRSPDDSFFADLAVVTSTMNEDYYFYDRSLVNPVNNKWKAVNTMLTIGFRY